MATVAELTGRFEAAAADQHSRSQFHAGLCASVATDPGIVSLLQSAPEEQQLPVLLMAAVHFVVLAEPDHELAVHYPTVTPDPRPGDPFPAFQRLCLDRSDELRTILASRRVQTNEVGRSAILLPALAQLGREVGELALVDVGTSAGLNLQLDRFEYHYLPGGSVGDPSGVRIRTATNGSVPVPRSLPHVADRLGIDPAPIDPADPDDARWLMACVWPDQHDRFVRLREALSIARRHPVEIRTAGAVDGVGPAVDGVAGHPVVMNTWVLNYLTDDERRAFLASLEVIGSTRDLSWVYAEAPALCPGVPVGGADAGSHDTCLTLTTWRGGRRTTRHLATAHPHGYWLHWSSSPITE